MRSAPSLVLDVRASGIARTLLAVMLMLAVASVAASALAWVVKCAVGIAVMMLGARSWRTLRRIEPSRAVLQSDGTWLLSSAHGEQAAALVSSSRLGLLIGLRWREISNGRMISVLLWPDSIAVSARRPLNVWLADNRAHATTSSNEP